MLGIEILKRMSGGDEGAGVVLYDDYAEHNAYDAWPSSAIWSLSAGVVTCGPNASYPSYIAVSGVPADYEVVIAGSGFTSGAAGTYACDTGVTLTVERFTQGSTSAHFSAKIQLAANPGVYLAEASITIFARTFNGSEP